MKHYYKLNVLLPVVITLFTLLVILLAFYSSRSLVIKDVVDHSVSAMYNRLHFFQGSTARFIRDDNIEDIQQLVASMASEQGLISLIVVNSQNKVIASNSFAEVGKDWYALEHDILPEKVDAVINQRTILVQLNNSWLDGYSSLCAEKDAKTLRASRCGFVFYRIDMQYTYAQSIYLLKQEALFSFAGIIAGLVLLLFVVYVLITKRINKLVFTLKSYGSGNRKARVKLTGNDEVTLLGESINSLFDKIDKDEIVIKDREKRYKTLFDTVTDALVIVDNQGFIQQINPAALELFHYPESELVGQNITLILSDIYVSPHELLFSDFVDSGFSDSEFNKKYGSSREILVKQKNGTEIPVELSVSHMTVSGKQLMTVVIRDISDRKRMEKALRKMNTHLLKSNKSLEITATTDSLTELANRRYFDKVLQNEINRSKRDNLCLTLILCDVDFFKNYNDTYGHLAGDDCLKNIGRAMKQVFQRSGELPARYGGEEFAIILPNVNENDAGKLALSLHKAIAALKIPHSASTVNEQVTISIGFTTYVPGTHGQLDVSDLIKCADHALYLSKSNGRNQTSYFALEKIIETDKNH